MSKIVYPEYQLHIGGLGETTGKHRFFMAGTVVKDVRLHHHDYVELNYVLEGSGIQMINGIAGQLRPGTLSFVLPHHMHEMRRVSDEPSARICCMFDLQLLLGGRDDSELSRLLYGVGTSSSSFVQVEGERNERIRRLFQELQVEYNVPGQAGYRDMIRSILTEILLLFVRAGNGSATSGPVYEQKDNWFWHVLIYIHVHYAECVTLESISRQFNISVTHISRTFKKQTGLSFLEYLQKIRIDSACSLLAHTNMPITDITFETGFESFRSFSRVFRDTKGLTASEYRKQAAERMNQAKYGIP
ncbi:helix-turn-helix domain-containing protein [Paenibacillus oceani]|uniref:AraC family transcriptional regulator n=1 Tax=Paenibacillus oceani TaxID=2772510 RepID=A0A927CGV8_9BACL|nr:AraC family transcriptional regulator [Paenibacillus oceani]MBD2866362.1 AraC family transcriptional regulator [Paenibacillus oceani]